MKVKKIITFLIKALFICVLFIGVLELSARVDDYFTWGAPIFANYTHDELRIGDSLGFHNRPNAKFQKWEINSHGFRSPETTREKPDSVIRVIMTGASETFGLLESPGMEYSAQMQSILDSIYPGKFEILNSACPGMTPPRIEYYYNVWLKSFDPDIICYYPTPAFYLNEKPVPKEMNIDIIKTWRPKKEYRLKDKIRIVLKRFIPHEVQTMIKQYMMKSPIDSTIEGWTFVEPPRDRIELFKDHFSDLIRTIQNDSVSLIIATHANRFGDTLTDEDEWHLRGALQYYPRATSQTFLDFDFEANKEIRALSEELQVPLADVEKIMPKGGEVFADAGHFTDKGARIIAELFILRILEETKKIKNK